MANAKKKVAPKKPMSLKDRIAQRRKMMDDVSGFGEEPVKKDRKIPLPKKYQ